MLRQAFTLGNVRTANIMVEQDPNGSHYILASVINWEDRSFYPAYDECTALTHTLSPVNAYN